jgi:antitoxin component YwqK of YwqJK toxin-antitoxin module
MCEITTGLIRTFHDKEKTKLKEKIQKSYWRNGQLWREVNYINDKKEGNYKVYWYNGQLYSKVNFINDKKEGIQKSYTRNGQLYSKVNYINDNWNTKNIY